MLCISTFFSISQIFFYPFADGNKRVGTYAMLVLLELNRIEADFTDGDIIRIGLEIADGKMDALQLLSLILERTVYQQ